MENDTSKRGNPGGRVQIALWIVEIVLVAFWIVIVIGVGRHTLAFVGLVGLWGIGVVIILVLLGLAGREISGQWFGVLIDSRNKVSLSRLQITLWTTMVLSAYLAIAIPRVIAMTGNPPTLNQEEALNIGFPDELLLAMGISATSFAGSSLIKSNKKNKTVQIDLKSTPESAQDKRDEAKREFDKADDALEKMAQIENDRKKSTIRLPKN